MTLKPGHIRISSGGLTRWVKATTPDEAFRIFLARYNPKSLGQIVEIRGECIDDPEHTAYASTERLLREMGKWSDT